MVSGFELVVASTAADDLRLVVSGEVGPEEGPRVNEALVAALRAGPRAVHLDVRDAVWPEASQRRVVGPAVQLARHLDIRLIVVGQAASSGGPMAATRGAAAPPMVRGRPGRQTMLPIAGGPQRLSPTG